MVTENSNENEPNKARDQQREEKEELDMPPTTDAPMPTVQAGVRIRWDLDRKFRKFVAGRRGTYRAHFERALEEYIQRHEDE